MKATFKLVIRDEDGNIVGQHDPYHVNLGDRILQEIDGDVEQWRQQSFQDIEAYLLTHAQHTQKFSSARH